jgi:cytochrome c oxidase cbb3-type subunit 3/ubiquinol-cytochrome c reductase cytochrome c subunit
MGHELYDKYCKLCHGAEGKGYAADNAPSLVSKTFLESATDSFITRGIRLGRSNTAMAAYGKVRGGPLTEKEIRAIVAFLRSKGPLAISLPESPVTGDPKRGKTLFGAKCKECHGTETTRATALSLHNPELAAAATPAFLSYAIRQGRPETPMPAFADKLKAGEIDDLVAFIKSFAADENPPPVADTKIPDDLPIVINPEGKPPNFDLRDGRFVAADQVKKALDEKRRIVLVDARSPADWIQFRIPGAISIAYHDTERLTKIPNDGTWVVAYCACPHHASGEVVDALRKRNYKNTAVLDEGILVWKQRGYALVGESVGKGPRVPPGAKPAAAIPAAPPAPAQSAGK